MSSRNPGDVNDDPRWSAEERTTYPLFVYAFAFPVVYTTLSHFLLTPVAAFVTGFVVPLAFRLMPEARRRVAFPKWVGLCFVTAVTVALLSAGLERLWGP